MDESTKMANQPPKSCVPPERTYPPFLDALIRAMRDIKTSRSREDFEPLFENLAFRLHLVGGGGKAPQKSSNIVNYILDEMYKVRIATTALYEVLSDLKPPARSAFQDFDKILDTIKYIEDTAKRRRSHSDITNNYIGRENVAGCRPPVILALEAAHVFEFISGERPTMRYRTRPTGSGAWKGAYGPYYEFLEKIFKIRGIQASPENSGREALKIYGAEPPQKTG